MYKITLPNFEGPFDLLLYFIKRDEINIYDIPIARITAEFLKYVRYMQLLDLELAGEFIVTAATLVYIKSQMLLPRDDSDSTSNETPEDPRAQLVQKLIEYKKFKEAALELSELSEENRYYLFRRSFDLDRQTLEENASYKNSSVFDLMAAFGKILERRIVLEAELDGQHLVQLLPVTIEEQSDYILSLLNKKSRTSFSEITSEYTKQYLVITFLAMLDLIKTSRILAFQDLCFEDIIITKIPEYSLN